MRALSLTLPRRPRASLARQAPSGALGRLYWRVRWRLHGDSLLTAHLLDACDEPGCPICRLLADGTLRSLTSLLYEYVNDLGTARAFLASRGLCTEHTWAFPAASAAAHSPTGVATLYERLLIDLLRHAATPTELARWLGARGACSLCALTGAIADTYLSELARLLDRGHWALAGDAVTLCQPHLRVLAGYLDRPALASATEAALADERLGWTSRLALRVGYRPVGALPLTAACPLCQAALKAALALEAGAIDVLCRHHVWALLDEGRDDLTAAVRAEVVPACCPACQASALAVEAAIDTLEDDGALCLGHLLLVLQRGWLVGDAAITSLRALHDALLTFRNSAKYPFTGVLSAAERQSWLVVLTRFGGESVHASLARPLPWLSLPER